MHKMVHSLSLSTVTYICMRELPHLHHGPTSSFLHSHPIKTPQSAPGLICAPEQVFNWDDPSITHSIPDNSPSFGRSLRLLDGVSVFWMESPSFGRSLRLLDGVSVFFISPKSPSAETEICVFRASNPPPPDFMASINIFHDNQAKWVPVCRKYNTNEIEPLTRCIVRS